MDSDFARSAMRPEPFAPPGASLNMPPALDSAVGRRLAMLLAQTPLSDRRAWGAAFASFALADVADVVSFSPEGYTRTLLACTEDAEILVLGWLPGQASPVHGHGASEGLIQVLAGVGSEECYRLDRGELVSDRVHTFAEGERIVEPRGSHHRVWNSGAAPLVTLHLYAPRQAH